MRFVIRVAINAFAIWVVSLIPVLQVRLIAFAPGEWLQVALTALLVGFVFAIVNGIIGTILKVLAFPLYILTLGLISLVINGFLLWLTAWITSIWDFGLRVDHFWWGVVAALLITVINAILGAILQPTKRD